MSMSDWDYSRPADERYDAPRPSWPDGTTYPYPLPFPLAQALDGDEPAGRTDGSSYPWPPAPPPAWLRDRQSAGDPPGTGSRREHGGRRWLIPAGLVAGAAALGGAVVLLTS